MPRVSFLALSCLLAACGDDTAPGGPDVALPGGGLSGGELRGELHVRVIDLATGAPIGGADVHVGPASSPLARGSTADDGTVTLSAAELTGAVSVTASASAHVTTSFVGVDRDGATIALEPSVPPAAARIRGTVAGLAAEAPAAGLRRIAIVSASVDEAAAPFAIPPPLDTSAPYACTGGGEAPCEFTVTALAGERTVFATVIDLDEGDPSDPADDVPAVVGFVLSDPLTVVADATVEDVALDTDATAVEVPLALPPPPTGVAAVVGVPGAKDPRDDQVLVVPSFGGVGFVPALEGPLADGRHWVIGRATSADSTCFATLVDRDGSTAGGDAWLPLPELAIADTEITVGARGSATVRDVRWGAATLAWRAMVFGDASGVPRDLVADALPGATAVTARAAAAPAEVDPHDIAAVRRATTSASSCTAVVP